MPANTVKVDRSTLWGNPFGWQTGQMPDHGCRSLAVHQYRELLLRGIVPRSPAKDRPGLLDRRAAILANISQLRGLNLACWCPPGAPCHADVLLEIANRPGLQVGDKVPIEPRKLDIRPAFTGAGGGPSFKPARHGVRPPGR